MIIIIIIPVFVYDYRTMCVTVVIENAVCVLYLINLINIFYLFMIFYINFF